MKPKSGPKNGVAAILAAWIIILGVSSCSLTPDPLETSERFEQIQDDQFRMFNGQEPISDPLTLCQAIARAIKYNLDHRVKMMENVIASGQMELARYDMLPRLTTEAGFDNRNNFAGGTSISFATGEESLVPSYSVEKRLNTANLEFSWSILDLGVSYMRARQQANLFLVSEERKRRIIQTMTQDITSAYWRAVAMERRAKEIDTLMPDIKKALSTSKIIEQQRLQAPIVALDYQRNMLQLLQQVVSMRSTMGSAKTELAALMSLNPNLEFQIHVPSERDLKVPQFQIDVESLDELALLHRPELVEEHYLIRVGRDEVTRAWIELMPNFNIDATNNYNSNSLAVNKTWVEYIGQLTLDLVKLATGRSRIHQSYAQAELGHVRRLALSMAIMAQARVSHARYDLSQEDYKIVQELYDVDQRFYHQMISGLEAKTQPKLEIVRAALSKTISGLQKDLSYADLQTALGGIFLSIGLDPYEEALPTDDLNLLSQEIEKRLTTWYTTSLAELQKLKEMKKQNPIPQNQNAIQPQNTTQSQNKGNDPQSKGNDHEVHDNTD